MRIGKSDTFNESAVADRGASFRQIQQRITLRVTAATNANTRKVVKRARKERLNGDLKDVDTMRTFIGRAGERAEIGQLLA